MSGPTDIEPYMRQCACIRAFYEKDLMGRATDRKFFSEIPIIIKNDIERLNVSYLRYSALIDGVGSFRSACYSDESLLELRNNLLRLGHLKAWDLFEFQLKNIRSLLSRLNKDNKKSFTFCLAHRESVNAWLGGLSQFENLPENLGLDVAFTSGCEIERSDLERLLNNNEKTTLSLYPNFVRAMSPEDQVWVNQQVSLGRIKLEPSTPTRPSQKGAEDKILLINQARSVPSSLAPGQEGGGGGGGGGGGAPHSAAAFHQESAAALDEPDDDLDEAEKITKERGCYYHEYLDSTEPKLSKSVREFLGYNFAYMVWKYDNLSTAISCLKRGCVQLGSSLVGSQWFYDVVSNKSKIMPFTEFRLGRINEFTMDAGSFKKRPADCIKVTLGQCFEQGVSEVRLTAGVFSPLPFWFKELSEFEGALPGQITLSLVELKSGLINLDNLNQFIEAHPEVNLVIRVPAAETLSVVRQGSSVQIESFLRDFDRVRLEIDPETSVHHQAADPDDDDGGLDLSELLLVIGLPPSSSTAFASLDRTAPSSGPSSGPSNG